MPRSLLSYAALSVLFLALAVQSTPAGSPVAKPAVQTAKVVIDLDRAQKLSIPEPAKDLLPITFKLQVSGWVLRIPGQKALATPACYKGRLYVGGGYGSYEFYCFDADTGRKIWQYHTNDDGPTAAVVEDGCVAFNTESCTVFVLEADTGKCLWQEWLGDPLMSQPAIARGKLYIAYPGGQRGQGQQLQAHGLLQEAQRLVHADERPDEHGVDVLPRQPLHHLVLDEVAFVIPAV